MAIELNAAPTDFLAADRTILAWIRTGLALIGFGFVVARFGHYLQTLELTEPAFHRSQPDFLYGSARL